LVHFVFEAIDGQEDFALGEPLPGGIAEAKARMALRPLLDSL